MTVMRYQELEIVYVDSPDVGNDIINPRPDME